MNWNPFAFILATRPPGTRALQLDTDESRTVFLVMFFRIFELHDIVVRTEHVIQELAKSPGPLREVDHKIVLEPFVDERAFLDLLHPVDIVIASTNDAYDVFAAQRLRIERGQRRDG